MILDKAEFLDVLNKVCVDGSKTGAYAYAIGWIRAISNSSKPAEDKLEELKEVLDLIDEFTS